MSGTLHKAQNYWVSLDKTAHVDFAVHGTCVRGAGNPAVRYDETADRVVLVLGGHHASGRMPELRLKVSAALELADLLEAAAVDALAPGQPLFAYVDVTAENCDCAECAAVRAADRALCVCPECLVERSEGNR
ncbi:hypothetical protein [Nocardia noduli]|uniref:hypothetical protein n=1 Tax=Nocardia noduli TaxID=2815722 RepID=UPI001C23C47A|nr:hypothetical protein [Nocardia noduli]